jgi:hypothetical protein
MTMGAAVLPRALTSFGEAKESSSQSTAKSSSRISFETSDSQYQIVYTSALDILAHNTVTVMGYSESVLIEGRNYLGIWLECAPYEA